MWIRGVLFSCNKWLVICSDVASLPNDSDNKLELVIIIHASKSVALALHSTMEVNCNVIYLFTIPIVQRSFLTMVSNFIVLQSCHRINKVFIYMGAC